MKKDKITIMGVGTSGTNIATRLYNISKFENIYQCDTHIGRLSYDPKYPNKIQLGKESQKYIAGCGGDIFKGKAAVIESTDEIKKTLKDTDILFLITELGDGTGTLGISEIARIAKEQDILVISIVTLPLNEETTRIDKSKIGLKKLLKLANTTIVIDQNKIVDITKESHNTKIFAIAQESIAITIKSMINSIQENNLVKINNYNFENLMQQGNIATIKVESISNKNYYEQLKDNHHYGMLLDAKISNKSNVIMHISGNNLDLESQTQIANKIIEKLDKKSNVIWSAEIDSSIDETRVITILTNLNYEV